MKVVKNGVVSVVTVVSGQKIAIPEKSPVVLPSLPCSLKGDPVVRKESDTIEAELQRAEEQAKAKEEHFKKVAEEHTGKMPLVCAKCGEDLTGHGNIPKRR